MVADSGGELLLEVTRLFGFALCYGQLGKTALEEAVRHSEGFVKLVDFLLAQAYFSGQSRYVFCLVPCLSEGGAEVLCR